ncbi:hypothetical protein PRIPAC_90295, partial [Pristionchus pacificus]|uniref:Uncharacterized protein n=1 Tax=Pristionchus pacificus TaxID=54126 RepID=A0A2A6CWW2_PRIPA
MEYNATFESICQFLDAIVLFYTSYPDRPIKKETLSTEEREVILRTNFHENMRFNSQPWAFIQTTMAFVNSFQLPTDRLRALLRGCQMLRLNLYPVIYSIREGVVTEDE